MSEMRVKSIPQLEREMHELSRVDNAPVVIEANDFTKALTHMLRLIRAAALEQDMPLAAIEFRDRRVGLYIKQYMMFGRSYDIKHVGDMDECEIMGIKIRWPY